VAINVAVFTSLVVGLFLALELLGSPTGLAGGSPFMGVVLPFFGHELDASKDFIRWRAWLAVWTFIYTVVSGVFYLATLMTFDRCLGRASTRKSAIQPEGTARAGRWRRALTGATTSMAALLPSEP
jgi:hypothetical protein